MIKVQALEDDSGHWYLVPNHLADTFMSDLYSGDDDFLDSGRFDEIYGQYRTGGDLNTKQLYVET